MRIKSVDITSFGGLKNKHIDFSDGFNVIYGENENGKSTVAAFIKMMFYGTERGSAQISKNPRKKYAPWDDSKMAGSIEFEQNGRNYRLDREFKSSNTTDKVTLTDLDLGEKTVAAPDFGKTVFGLSSAAFERSVFIRNTGIPENDPSAESEINSKLSNIALSGDETVSYNTVNSRIEKAKNVLISKNGKSGEYIKCVKRIEEINATLLNAERIYSKHADYIKTAETLSADIKNAEKKIAELNAVINSEQDIRNANKLKEMLETKKNLDALCNSMRLSNGEVADDVFVNKIKFCLTKLEKTAESLKNAQAETERLNSLVRLSSGTEGENSQETATLENEVKSAEERLQKARDAVKQNEQEYFNLSANEYEIQNRRKGISIPLVVLASVFLISSAVMFFMKLSLPSLIGLVLGITLAAAAFFLRPRDKAALEEYYRSLKELRQKAEELKATETEELQNCTAATARYQAAKISFGEKTAAAAEQKRLIEESHTKVSELKDRLEKENADLFCLFGRYGKAECKDDIMSALDGLTSKAAKLKALKQNLAYLTRDLGDISYEEAQTKLDNISAKTASPDFDALKAERDRLNAITVKNKEISAAAAAEDRARLENAPDTALLKKELKRLLDLKLKEEKFCRASQVAADTLKDSFAELRKSYGSTLEKKAGKIFSGLTGGAYDGVEISKSFDISAQKAGVFGSKELAFLSSGTIDQAYLSLRLALSELIFENAESVPVILDDSLSQYDDKRAKTAMEYLNIYSENCQIIMFTCHGALLSLAKDEGISCSPL